MVCFGEAEETEKKENSQVFGKLVDTVFKDVRNACYDGYFSVPPLGTPYLYTRVLESIPDHAKVLEVGIGNGLCLFLEENREIIRRKNIRIVGIDIDEDYIEACQGKIAKHNMGEFVSATVMNLFDVQKGFAGVTEGFDVILFMESIPVIGFNLANAMLNYSKRLFKDSSSKFVMVHNITNNPHWFMKFLKPRLKFIPFLWVDFGNILDDDFHDRLSKSAELSWNKRLIASLPLYDVMKLFKADCLNIFLPKYNVEQYLIEMKPN